MKTKVGFSIIISMLCYSLLINLILLAIFFSNKADSSIIVGFNCGFIANFFGFFSLLLSYRWLGSGVPLKQTFAYLLFFIRMIIYGLIIIMASIYAFANIISIVAGFSVLMIAAITSGLLILEKEK